MRTLAGRSGQEPGEDGLVPDEDDRVLGMAARVGEGARHHLRPRRDPRPSHPPRRVRRGPAPQRPPRNRQRSGRDPRSGSRPGYLDSSPATTRRPAFSCDRLAAVVPPAGRADPVRQLRLVAMRALDERRQGEGEVAPALHLPRVSDLSLRHTHVGLLLLSGGCSSRGWTPRSGLVIVVAPVGSGARTRNRRSWGRSGSLPRLGPRRRPGTPGAPRGAGRSAAS